MKMDSIRKVAQTMLINKSKKTAKTSQYTNTVHKIIENSGRATAKHIPGPCPLAAVSLMSQEFKFSAMEEMPRKAVANCRALSADF